MPDIREKLDKGVKFADFGCGTGRSAGELAKRFKKSTIINREVLIKKLIVDICVLANA